jgi:hypothetical protein
MASQPARVAWSIVRIVLRVVWIGVMVLVPLFGFWLASSLAAYQNASQWLALVVGLLLFPIVPVGWDLVFVWRRSRRKVQRKQILTRLDRLVLRTLFINGIFLTTMMWTARHTALHAIAQRGDWMLDGYDGPVATKFRGWLLALADRLDRRGADDHYGKSDDAPDPSTVMDTPEPTPTPTPLPDIAPPKSSSGWPLDPAVDPAIAMMPEDAQASIDSVGAYLLAHFPDPKARVKALHDFVVLRLTYDQAALRASLAGDFEHRPSQEAAAVFARKTAVCEGYARLVAALGKPANLEIAYITGYIRDTKRRTAAGSDESVKASLEGYLHAWNAVKIDNQWLLIDATFDDPVGATTPVSTTYLFTPPKLFAYDHLPEDAKWQLVATPLTPGDFVRQPMLSPSIGALGVTLIDPARAQVTASGEITLVLDNPYRAKLMAIVKHDDKRDTAERECSVAASIGTRVSITCPLDDGEHEIRLFGTPATNRRGSYDYVGSILANSR